MHEIYEHWRGMICSPALFSLLQQRQVEVCLGIQTSKPRSGDRRELLAIPKSVAAGALTMGAGCSANITS